MISNKIKMLRNQTGMSQTELAKKLGITRSSINAWEMGISIPSTQYLVELAILFKTTTDYLLDIEDELMVKTGHLKDDQREMIYKLINQFEKYNKAMRLINQNSIKFECDV